MKSLLANPYISRLIGALGAGLTVFIGTGFQDPKTALATAVTFAIYGAAHASSTAVGDKQS